MDKPKISIITVSYNAVKTIEQTIQSVVNQAYDNIEYIIIDGGSTDGTVDIIKKYEDKIAYWVSEPDDGIYDAMNKGIDIASGDYIYFLNDGDQFYNKNTIQMFFEQLGDIGLYILCGRIIQTDYNLLLMRCYGGKLSCRQILEGYMPPHQGMFIPVRLAKKYKFDTTYKIAADFDLLTRLLVDKIEIKFLEDIVAFHEENGISGAICNQEQLYKEYKNILFGLGNKKAIKQFLSRYKKNKIKNIFLEILPQICIVFLKKKNGWETFK
ncbi:glycosyltransferase family 2 protein [Pectinatus frisingensis]|uniref:glycosyltransferase family 2 protein n=1 Tax=Pectinatus frisingensis TaxID=865 RepID=UPI0018C59F0A|nr:glycosyltransferase family 2 protein [Pectinatus frisingensis]